MREDQLISIGRNRANITIGAELKEEFGYDRFDSAKIITDPDAELAFITFGEKGISVIERDSGLVLSGAGAIAEMDKAPPEETVWPPYIVSDDMIRLDLEMLPDRATTVA